MGMKVFVLREVSINRIFVKVVLKLIQEFKHYEIADILDSKDHGETFSWSARR